MALDDIESLRNFISQMSTITDQDNQEKQITSQEAPPQNTPKLAASTATNTHNQEVADAFSDYVNNMNGRPLSESIWAPGSTNYKPSMLSGARSANVLTPVNSVQLDPAVNDTFDRMTFKAANCRHKNDENIIGDQNTRSLFSKAPPSFVNKRSLLADKIYEDKEDDSLTKTSDKDLEPSAHTETAETDQAKANRASEKENNAYLPPHLRAPRGSSQKPDQKPGKTETKPSRPEGLSPVVPSKPAASGPPHLLAIRGSSQKPVKTETNPSHPEDAPSQSEDLEHETFFNTWPKLERSRPAAKVRKVIIKNLPPRGSTATFVASLVYGGPIEEIHVRASAAGEPSAAIRFMNAEDCMRFYNETSNGLVWQKDSTGRELFVFVELSKDVDVVGGLLQGWILSGVTRCVRAVGVDAEWGMEGLLKIAERKNRKVEKIVDGQNPGGARSVVFRFCKVEDAVQFKAALSRDEEWEHCNVHYAVDPCAAATGVHFES